MIKSPSLISEECLDISTICGDIVKIRHQRRSENSTIVERPQWICLGRGEVERNEEWPTVNINDGVVFSKNSLYRRPSSRFDESIRHRLKQQKDSSLSTKKILAVTLWNETSDARLAPETPWLRQ